MEKYSNQKIRRIIKNDNPHWALSYLSRFKKSKYAPELVSIILVGTSILAIHGLSKLDIVPSVQIKKRLQQLGFFL